MNASRMVPKKVKKVSGTFSTKSEKGVRNLFYEHVHPGGHPLDRGPPALRGGQAEDLLRERAQADALETLVFNLEPLPLLLRPALAVPADLVHVGEELEAVAFRVLEVEGVIAARPFVLDLAQHAYALCEQVLPDTLH